jgi:hypothetical protein
LGFRNIEEKLEKTICKLGMGVMKNKNSAKKNRQKSDQANKNCHFGMPHKKTYALTNLFTPQRDGMKATIKIS